jgi:hypothetical protein
VDAREERTARNEALLREVNDRIHESASGSTVVVRGN